MKYTLLLILAVVVLSGCQEEIIYVTVTPSPVPPTRIVTAIPTYAAPATHTATVVAIESTATKTPFTPPPTMTSTPLFAPTDTPIYTPTFEPSSTLASISASPDAEVLEIGDGLRVRSEPGLSAETVSNLPAGTKLRINGRTGDGGWYQIESENSIRGWVWGAYLRVYIDASTVPVTAEALQIPTVPAPAGVSVISGVSSNARLIFERGQQLGNRRDVFSKIGDSLTVATFVMYPFGWGSYNLGGYQHLQSAINFFSGTNAREGNSFANVSLSADNGWTTRDLLDPARARGGVCQAGETPLECEYRVVKPSVALILIGTNDVSSVPLAEYSANLQRIVQITIERGIIPVVSTIPNRAGYDVSPYNQAIIQIARLNDIPLWDYWSAMQILPNTGLSSDGVHPSYPSETDFGMAANFSDVNNLQYGYVIRNLTALEALDAVWRFVLSY